MSRKSFVFIALLGSTIIVLACYRYLQHAQNLPEGDQQGASVTLGTTSTIGSKRQPEEAGGVQVGATLLLPADDVVTKWIVESSDPNPVTRANAITALAKAPKARVVATLQGVLHAGEPEVDRQLALESLRTLALQQGDGDGGIRDVLRDAIYDGSDEAITLSAQYVLDEIETVFMNPHTTSAMH